MVNILIEIVEKRLKQLPFFVSHFTANKNCCQRRITDIINGIQSKILVIIFGVGAYAHR